MTQLVINGTWEDVREHNTELNGHTVTVIVTDAQDDVSAEFQRLVDNWRHETGIYSTIERKSMHPSYQRIIGMGEQALPLILREMTRRPEHWFWALRAISGKNPIPAEHVGEIDAMTKDWLTWGTENKYIA